MHRIKFTVRGRCNGLSSRQGFAPRTMARVLEAATAMVEGDPFAGGGVWGNPLQSGGSQTQTHFPGFANLLVVHVLIETSPPMAQFR